MDVIQKFISRQDYFPGNPYFPLLIYKQCLLYKDKSAQAIQVQLHHNDWKHSWVDSIYDYHHYHSNTHEVLVIIAGVCEVQFGGDEGPAYTVNPADVIIIPAGIAHKSLHKSNDFQCIGAYPFEVDYNMKYGKQDEYQEAVEAIQQVGLPKKDPIFGEEGALMTYWKAPSSAEP